MKSESQKTIGIIGAGQMGSGIAQICAQSGFTVILSDISNEILNTAINGVRKRIERLVERKKLSKNQIKIILGKITITQELKSLGVCDFVLEAVTEDEKVKVGILQNLQPHIGKNTILLTNTSSISITRLASKTDRPEKFMGLHFMNPVHVMKLVELIRGVATDDTTFEAVTGLVSKLEKTAIISEDFPAFILNRILIPMLNEAIYVVHEGVGTIKDVDTAMKLGAHHPMGPLELADFIGLDTCLSIMQVIHKELGDSKFRPCPLLSKFVEAGWLGRKTKIGFYDYSGQEPVPIR